MSSAQRQGTSPARVRARDALRTRVHNTALRGPRLYLLSLCRCMPQDDTQMRHAPNLGTCGVSMRTQCGVCGMYSCIHAWRRGRRRRVRWLTLCTHGGEVQRCYSGEDRTHRRCDRCQPRCTEIRRGSPQMSAEMHRDTPRLSRCQPRCTEIRRGSPHRNGGKLRCGSGLDGGVQAAGSTVALCANPNEGCARTHVSKHFYSHGAVET
jgi:hypothetical protein